MLAAMPSAPLYDHWVAAMLHTWPGAAIRSPEKATRRPSISARRVIEPVVCPGVGTMVKRTPPNSCSA